MASYWKEKKEKDPELLELYRNSPCLICGSTPSDPHHLTTTGSGGGDNVQNLVSLCRKHHTEIHSIGMHKFSFKYPEFLDVLEELERWDLLSKIENPKTTW